MPSAELLETAGSRIDERGGEWAEFERVPCSICRVGLIGGVACMMMSLGKYVPAAGVACLIRSPVGVVCLIGSLVGVACVEVWLLWEKGKSGGLLVISPTTTRCRLPSHIRPHPKNLERERGERFQETSLTFTHVLEQNSVCEDQSSHNGRFDTGGDVSIDQHVERGKATEHQED